MASDRYGPDGEGVAARIITRASSPYHNPRCLIRNLSVDATARNYAIEIASGDIFKGLEATHHKILSDNAKNPALFNASEYSVLPYVLGTGRYRGDLFVSELARPEIRCRSVEAPGSPARLCEAGADAPYGFLLLHGDSPIAAVSYMVIEGPSLFVVMTQRLRQRSSSSIDAPDMKLHEKAIRRLHLRDALLSLCSSIGSAFGCTSLTYQGASQNRWVHEMVPDGPDDGWSVSCKPRLSLSDAKKIYDDFCLERGFTFDPKSGNFCREI